MSLTSKSASSMAKFVHIRKRNLLINKKQTENKTGLFSKKKEFAII